MNEDDAPSPRLASIDIARGIAVFGMFGYHLTWDLANFGFIDRMAPFAPSFRVYSHVVACAFVFLAGVSLVLARKSPFAWDRWTRHIGVIVLAAAVVTAASYVAFPDGLIGFGILHCIAAALIVATPLLFAPPAFALIAALIIAAAPLVIQSSVFNTPALIWTGLGTIEPSSNDFRAFFPWAAPAFAGLGMMAFGEAHNARGRLARWRPHTQAWRILAFCGRHSLAIYLIHQPLLFAVLAGIAALAFSPPAEQSFLQPCRSRCEASGAASVTCTTACACTERGLRAEGIFDRVRTGTLDEAQRLRLSRITQACLRTNAPD